MATPPDTVAAGHNETPQLSYKRTSRSAFSDTHRSWQVAVSEGETCTRGLRIAISKRSTFTALASSPRVRLRSTTNTQPRHDASRLCAVSVITRRRSASDTTTTRCLRGRSRTVPERRRALEILGDCPCHRAQWQKALGASAIAVSNILAPNLYRMGGTGYQQIVLGRCLLSAAT